MGHFSQHFATLLDTSSQLFPTLLNMKYLLMTSALLASAYGMEVAMRQADGQLQFIDFNDPVIQELIQKLLALKKELLCGGTIDQLIEALNLPEQLIGALNLLKGILCIA